jgi:ABC-type multidrug transport system ATPase subunit
VVVSTSYLDEAERCRHAIVMYEGSVLMQGSPEDVSRCAAGCVFLATPGKNLAARAVQTRLLGHPQVVDAVPEAGNVRVVTDGSSLRGLTQGLGFDQADSRAIRRWVYVSFKQIDHQATEGCPCRRTYRNRIE